MMIAVGIAGLGYLPALEMLDGIYNYYTIGNGLYSGDSREVLLGSLRFVKGIGVVTKAGNKAKYRSFTRGNYRHNLQVRTQTLGKGYDAHHIYPKARKFRKHWKRAGINNHHPSNMAWWKSGPHQDAADAYNKAWSEFFKKKPQADKGEIMDFGSSLMKSYGF